MKIFGKFPWKWPISSKSDNCWNDFSLTDRTYSQKDILRGWMLPGAGAKQRAILFAGQVQHAFREKLLRAEENNVTGYFYSSTGFIQYDSVALSQ